MPPKPLTKRPSKTPAKQPLTEIKSKASFKLDTVEWWDIDRVIPYALNSKKHPESQITKLISTIAEFGWDVPIVVDENGIIIKGHGRRLAALRMVLKQVPVIVRRDLSDAQKKACRIADNKVAESEWDIEMVKLEFEALAEVNFDLALTGFDEQDFSAFLGDGVDFQGKEFIGDDDREGSEEGSEDDLRGDRQSREEQEGDNPDEPTEGSRDKSDGSLLALINVTIADPTHKVNKGEVWELGPHVLICAEVISEWTVWVKYLEGDNVLFAPYPGAFVPLGVKADTHRLVMIQPDTYIAGHILDRYSEVYGGDSVKLNH